MARPVPLFISIVNAILVVFIFLVPVHTQGTDALCVPQIKLRKNTVYTATSESMLNISCPVTYCKKIPAVQWIKIDNASKFIHINETNQVTIRQEETGLNETVSYLSFKNISTDDSGVYRCMISTSSFSLESHNINVNVSEPSYVSANNTAGIAVPDVRVLLYVVIGLGILGLVVIVMLISFLCISQYSRKANNRSRKNATLHPKPLSAATSGKSQENPEDSHSHLPSEVCFLYTGSNQACTPDMRRGRSGDGSQIVYATLQHPSPGEPSAVRLHSREQPSEYASIRIS